MIQRKALRILACNKISINLRHYYYSTYFTSNIIVQIQKEMYLNHVCHLLAL